MNIKSVVMFVLFGIILIALGFIIGVCLEKRGTNKYDERQKITQGKGYRIAFWVLTGYIAFYAFARDLFINLKISEIFAMFIGIALAITVNAVYCIAKDAYVSYKDKISQTYLSLGVIAISNLIIGITNNANNHWELFKDGRFGFGFINFVCVAMLVIVIIAMAIKQLADKRSADKE